MTRRAAILLLPIACGAFTASTGAETTYVVTPLNGGTLGVNSAAVALAPDGTVVGCGMVTHPHGSAAHAVRGSATQPLVDLHPVTGGTSCAVSIDAAQRIALRVAEAAGDRAWIIEDGTTMRLPSANQPAVPTAFVAPDQLVGWVTLDDLGPRGALWSDGAFALLDAPAELAWSMPRGGDGAAVIVGTARHAARCCGEPAAWIDGTFTWLPVLPGSGDGDATAARGAVIVGTMWDPGPNQPVAVRWTHDGAVWTIETLPALDARSEALAVNAAGTIVGQSGCSGHCGRAVRWDDTTGIVDLQAHLPATSPWTLERAVAINDAGQIAVTGLDAFGERNACLLTPLANCPEDLDGDGTVGLGDLLDVLAAWGACPSCAADFDGSAEVGLSDLLFILSRWGACAP